MIICNWNETHAFSSYSSYEYVEKEMSEEEKEVWARRFYPKLIYTDDVDWPIREQLDAADDHIVEVRPEM